MTTTKPPRERGTTTPTYDRDREERAAAHRAIDAIFDAQPQAQLERDSIGFPTHTDHGGLSGHSEYSNVEAIATTTDTHRATDWLAERKEALSQLHRTANQARANWLSPTIGTTQNGVTIGTRTNTTETCTLCRNPIGGGRDDPIRRIDGDPFHKSPCWYTVTSDRQGRPTH